MNLRERFEAMIKREIALQAKGEKGHLIFKMNALVDPQVIRLLYHGVASGREGGAAGARHLLPAAGDSGSQREHPGDQRRRALPGT